MTAVTACTMYAHRVQERISLKSNYSSDHMYTRDHRVAAVAVVILLLDSPKSLFPVNKTSWST